MAIYGRHSEVNPPVAMVVHLSWLSSAAGPCTFERTNAPALVDTFTKKKVKY